MNRVHDWQVRLQAFAASRERASFVWGRNDCATTAADALQAITSESLCPELRQYASAREAMRILRRVGGVRGLASSVLGAPLPPVMARVGDLVAVKAGKREALAICNGATAFTAGVDGLVVVPMAAATAAWRVG